MKCYNCEKENDPKVTFCIECGTQIKGEKIDYADENKKYFTQTIALFVAVVLIITSSAVIDIPFFQHDVLFSSLLILVTVIFTLLDLKKLLSVFRFKFHYKPFLQIIIGAPVLAFIVIHVADWINLLFDQQPSYYFESYSRFTPNMYVYGTLFVAIIPGIFEELLFRGLLFNHLLKLTTPRITIIITAILFAFVHFSFISILWIGLIGLYLGYLRFRYRTILYGILFHILYNSSVFYIELLLKTQFS